LKTIGKNIKPSRWYIAFEKEQIPERNYAIEEIRESAQGAMALEGIGPRE
jgi:hypothetical protein